MNAFSYHSGELYAEQIPLAAIASRYGTPCFIYSRAALEHHWRAFDQAFGDCPHRVCYAVKANSNLAVLDVMRDLGSGFDIVSGGELSRVLATGANPGSVLFSGVGKSTDDIRAALAAAIGCFNVESASELKRLDRIAAAMNRSAPVSLRINPEVDAKTHPYIATGMQQNKFGIPIQEAIKLYAFAAASPNLAVVGVDFHIGSQLTDIAPIMDALERVLALVDTLQTQGITLSHINIGGGLGVRYREERPPPPKALIQAARERLGQRELELLIEPGRSISAHAGILLTRIEYLKHNGEKHFAVVDAAMNDLLRPALYGAWQNILSVNERTDVSARQYEVVGPVCESSDFLGTERSLAVAEGDLLAVCDVGAYGFVMSSNYNSRPRAAEVMVDKAAAHLVRQRETIADLYALESVLP